MHGLTRTDTDKHGRFLEVRIQRSGDQARKRFFHGMESLFLIFPCYGKIISTVWGLAAAVAAVAGLLLAPITFVHANMGFIGLKAFPAAVVGGFGSLPGAIVGGLVIGIVESLAGFYLPEGFKDIAAYVVVLIMLMVRPNGLFGEKLRKKV